MTLREAHCPDCPHKDRCRVVWTRIGDDTWDNLYHRHSRPDERSLVPRYDCMKGLQWYDNHDYSRPPRLPHNEAWQESMSRILTKYPQLRNVWDRALYIMGNNMNYPVAHTVTVVIEEMLRHGESQVADLRLQTGEEQRRLLVGVRDLLYAYEQAVASNDPHKMEDAAWELDSTVEKITGRSILS